MNKLPRHSTVVAYLALFIALATGGAYAVDKIGSGEIANNSIRSVDLKKRKAVKGSDVKRDSVGRKEIREESLDASSFARIAGDEGPTCNPESQTPIDCASATLTLEHSARILVVASGGQRSDGDMPASADCEIRIDGVPQPLRANPGEDETDNTSATATNGFARTLVPPDPLDAGSHEVALACSEGAGDVVIQDATIAAIAISAR